MAEPRSVLRQASAEDAGAVRGLRAEAAGWLGTQNTGQWALPNENHRDDRIKRAEADEAAGRFTVAGPGPPG